MTFKCTECGLQMRLKDYHHRQKVGEFTVSDRTCQAHTCACGNVALSADELRQYEWRAVVLVLVQAKSVSGQVLKAARKTLGLRQKDFAKLLQCNEQQVSRWENAAVIDRTIQLATVALMLVKLDWPVSGRDLHARHVWLRNGLLAKFRLT